MLLVTLGAFTFAFCITAPIASDYCRYVRALPLRQTVTSVTDCFCASATAIEPRGNRSILQTGR